ncbi:EamA family transporter [Priestia flexa]|uniref:EamA family transporter n=1 Tax=Priestia flexa TaxID=86664 RepID=UPI001CFCC857|nr:DMT family transporter [Priestia flexa]
MNLWFYALLVFLGGCSYGVVSTFVKLGYAAGFGVNALTGSQYLLGALLLWILASFVPKSPLRKKNWAVLLLSGTPMGLTGIFYNYALSYINASFAIILLLQFTWISMILQYVFDKKAPTSKQLVAAAIIMVGSLLASGVAESTIAFSGLGILFGLLAAVSFSFFIFFSGRTSISIHPIRKSAIMTTGAALLIFIVMPPTFMVEELVSTHLWMYGLLMGLFGSLLPPILFNIGMPKVGGNLGAILSASELPTAVFMSTFVLHESVASIQWMGVILILAGIAFPSLKRKERYQVRL